MQIRRTRCPIVPGTRAHFGRIMSPGNGRAAGRKKQNVISWTAGEHDADQNPKRSGQIAIWAASTGPTSARHRDRAKWWPNSTVAVGRNVVQPVVALKAGVCACIDASAL